MRNIKAVKSQGDGDDRNNGLAEQAAAAANKVQQDIEAGRSGRGANDPGKAQPQSQF